jgi:hypothetical protein
MVIYKYAEKKETSHMTTQIPTKITQTAELALSIFIML